MSNELFDQRYNYELYYGTSAVIGVGNHNNTFGGVC